jgi:glycosyltransferase involved in cell wall biosynthesis
MAGNGEEAGSETVDGLVFYRTPGTASGPAGLREWREAGLLAARIVALARLAPGRAPCPFARPVRPGRAARRAAAGIPVVYEIRAFWEDAAVGNGTGREGNARYRLTRWLEDRVVAGADAVVTICQGLKDDLVARGGAGQDHDHAQRGRSRAVRHAAAPDRALAEQLDLGEGPVIGFLGSFYPYEGLDDLIAAMPAIVAQVPGARLLLVGGGPPNMPCARRPRLRRRPMPSASWAACRITRSTATTRSPMSCAIRARPCG